MLLPLGCFPKAYKYIDIALIPEIEATLYSIRAVISLCIRHILGYSSISEVIISFS